jgi:drug/metabolite transporter (DMT)-like permease
MKLAALQLQQFELLKFIINPYIILAIICFGLQGLFWQLALKKHNLSYAYYFTSLRYVFTLGFGYFVFSENVNFVHLFGLFIIILGIIVFVRPGRENV